MNRIDDILVVIFMLLVAVVVISFMLTIVFSVVDLCTTEIIEEGEISCQIVHMDIDHGKHHMTIVGDNISKTMVVDQITYALYKEGDNIMVYVKHYRNATHEYYTCEIKECKANGDY